MISLFELQRRINSGELSPDAAIAQSREAIGEREKSIGAFVCHSETAHAASSRSVARHRRRHQGHHRYLGFSDRDGLSRDLRRLAAARGCACRDDAEAGWRDHHRQDHDHGIRGQRSDADGQSTQHRSHAGRIVIGLRGSSGRRHDSAGTGNADRRLGDPAGLVLRRGRDQAVVPFVADDRREMLFVEPRYRRAVRGRCQRSGIWAFGHHRPARTVAGRRRCRRRASAL